MRRCVCGLLFLLAMTDSISASTQDAPPPPPGEGAPQEKVAKSSYSDKQVTSWELQAKAAVKSASLDEELAAKVVLLSVESRTRHAEGCAGLREEWLQQAEERLREMRNGGGAGPLFDRSDLDKSIASFTNRERTKLANELIKLMDRPLAAAVYPALARYDARVDSLAGLIASFGLDEERSLAATISIQEWHIATMTERDRPRQDRPLALENIRLAREKLMATMKELLDADHYEQFARAMTRTKPTD